MSAQPTKTRTVKGGAVAEHEANLPESERDRPLEPDELEQQRDEEARAAAEGKPESEPESLERRLPLIVRDGDAAIRAAEKEAKRHEAEYRAIFGDGFVANLCPHCDGVGYLEQPPPKPHQDFRRCGTCNGYGSVLTGALEGPNAFAECPNCSGRGYEQRQVYAPQAQAVPPPNGQTGDGWEKPSWMGDATLTGPPPPQPTWQPPTGA